MSDSQDFILDFEYDMPGEGLLDQSADWLEEPMDQDDVIILDEGEYQPPEPVEPPEPTEPADLGSMLACGDRDIYDEDAPPSLYTLSQLVADVNVPTQEDPEVPARSPRTEEALQPVHIGDWSSECEQNAPLDAGLEEQDVGQEDPCLPSQSAEPIPLGQGCSRQKFEPWSLQFEPNYQRVKEYVQKV